MGFINSTIICNEKKQVDLDALNYIASGTLKELCACSYKNEKGHHHFIYETDGYFSLNQLQAGLTFENVIDLLSAALDLINSLQEYSLNLGSVKNAKEYIFKTDDSFKFVFIPISTKHTVHIKDFILKLISLTHFKDVRLSSLGKELRKKKNDEIVAYLTAFVSSYESNYGFSETETSLLDSDIETSLLGDELGTTLLNKNVSDDETSLLSNEEGTTLLSKDNDNSGGEVNTVDSIKITAYIEDESAEYETTVLSATPNNVVVNAPSVIESTHYLYLIRSLNGERINIDVTPFTIGKDSYNMDFVLNNDSVSRHHATILYEDGSYYIMDNNSTNGTMIEGVRLTPEEKGEIGNGYLISLGSESFQAHIERR